MLPCTSLYVAFVVRFAKVKDQPLDQIISLFKPRVIPINSCKLQSNLLRGNSPPSLGCVLHEKAWISIFATDTAA